MNIMYQLKEQYTKDKKYDVFPAFLTNAQYNAASDKQKEMYIAIS